MVETDPRVAELIGEVDRIVLPGPRKRVTDDVIAWGEREKRNLTADRLLEAYNEAVGVSIAQARSALERYASDPSKKSILITLLSEPRATDLHRQVALDALAGRLGQGGLMSEFGRVNAKQRPGVVPKVRQVLRDVDFSEARFLLRRVIPGSDDDVPGVIRGTVSTLQAWPTRRMLERTFCSTPSYSSRAADGEPPRRG